MYNPSVEEPNDTLLGPQNKIHSLLGLPSVSLSLSVLNVSWAPGHNSQRQLGDGHKFGPKNVENFLKIYVLIFT